MNHHKYDTAAPLRSSMESSSLKRPVADPEGPILELLRVTLVAKKFRRFHWFPLIRPAIRALFFGGWPSPLDCRDFRLWPLLSGDLFSVWSFVS